MEHALIEEHGKLEDDVDVKDVLVDDVNVEEQLTDDVEGPTMMLR